MADFKGKFSNLSAPWRWLVVVVSGIILLIIVLQLIISIFLDDYAARYIKKRINHSTHNVYSLDFDDLDIGLITGNVHFRNIRLLPDTSAYYKLKKTNKVPSLWGKAQIQKVDFNGISLWSLLFQKKLSIGSIVISRPECLIISTRQSESKDSNKFSSADSSIYAAISGKFTAFQLERFEIRDGTINLQKQHTGDENLSSVEQLNIILRNIRIDSASAQSGRSFITDNIQVKFKNYMLNLASGFYTLKLNAFNASTVDHDIELDSLQLIPRYPKYEFSQRKGVEIDRITLLIKKILMTNVNTNEYIHKHRFYTQKMTIDGANLKVFHDKKMPAPPNHHPELPNISFRQMKFPLMLDTINIKDSFISYSEQNPGVDQPGTVTFENLQATFYDLSNYTQMLKNNHIISLDARTNIMGKGLLKTHFSFPIGDKNGFHTVYGSLGEMKIAALNPMLENVGYVSADDGVIHSLNFSMNLNQQQSRGTLTLDYENLGITLLDKDNPTKDNGEKLKSFIANTFVIKKNNHEPPLRKGEIKFDRIERKSVFNFWWKSLLSGLKDTIGI